MAAKNYIILFSLFFVCCNKQTKNTTTEKFDFSAYQKRIKSNPESNTLILNDGTEIRQEVSAKNGQVTEYIKLPSPSFKTVVKSYHSKNYRLFYVVNLVGHMKVDTTLFYNENGVLTKEINENDKLNGFSYDDALKFLEKEKWIDIKTGKGRDNFSIDYKDNIWYITILSKPWNGNLETYYEVNASSGKIIKKEETKMGVE